MQKHMNYQQLEYSISKGTVGNMACAKTGKMNVIIFTASLSEIKCLIICVRDQEWKLAF